MNVLANLASSVRAHWKLSLSATFVLIACIDTFVASISTIAATFLGLAALPWILGLFEKVTLPGGIELELKNVEEKLKLASNEIHDADREAFKYFRTDDPNLAMAALRIEIEKRLRKISIAHELIDNDRPMGITSMVRLLRERGIVGVEVAGIIADMSPLLNAAAHGLDLPETSNSWVLRNGPKLLSQLDEKM